MEESGKEWHLGFCINIEDMRENEGLGEVKLGKL